MQQWLHDFDRLDALSAKQRDDAIGRRRSDNVELADAPPSAHVKRTAQELSTKGGNVRLESTGNTVLADGATVDISGWLLNK